MRCFSNYLLTRPETSIFAIKTTTETRTGSAPYIDAWNVSPWDNSTPSGTHTRSMAASPVRPPLGITQASVDNAPKASQYFSSSRATGQMTTNGTFDSHQAHRNSNPSGHQFGHQTRNSDEEVQIRHQINGWSNASASSRQFQSPTDGRNGRTSSYSTSGGSRDLSSPTSRNGSDSQIAELAAKFGQATRPPNSRGHTLSISSQSNGRPPFERQPSLHMQHNDFSAKSLLALGNGQNGMKQARAPSNAQLPHDLYANLSQNLSNGQDEAGLGGSFSEPYPTSQNLFPQQLPARSNEPGVVTANGNGFRQNSYHSTSTNSQLHDSTYPSERGQTYGNNYEQNELETKFRLLQLQQQQPQTDPRQRMQHATYQPSRMNPYAQSPYQLPLPVAGMQLQHMMPFQSGVLFQPAMAPTNMYRANEIPRGPRGDHDADNRIQSTVLADYKASYKSSWKRWELKVSKIHDF